MINDYDKFAKMRQNEILTGEKKSHYYVEKPMMKSMLPDLTNKKVLMLGCGTGDESIFLKEYGAKEIVGIDISEESIKIAKATYPDVQFLIADMHEIPFENESFDFVYSSLVIHYSEYPESVYREIYRVLKKDGELLFSVGHPLRWSVEEMKIDNKKMRVIGYLNSQTENEVYGNYNTFSKHVHKFNNDETLAFYVGNPSMHFKLLRKVGFLVEDFTESKCIEKAKEEDFNYYFKYSELPQFMAFLVKK